MIPVKLKLRNFMCYRQAELDLEGIHIACVCGENGSGKSALLDALTWALWGKARARTIDELVRLGQQDMEVELEFLAGDLRYRIQRKYSKASGRHRVGISEALLSLCGDGTSRLLTGAVRETDKKILELLKVDYDTFVRSAFLKQGEADLFTAADPAERKETLAKILGLELYDVLEERAKSKAKDLEAQRLKLEGELQRDEQELAKRPSLEESLAQASDDLAGLEAQWASVQKELEAIKERRSTLKQKQTGLADAAQRIGRLQDEIGQLQRQRTQLQESTARHTQVVADKARIQEGYERFQSALAQKEEMARKFHTFAGLDTRRTQLEGAIESARSALRTDERHLQQQVEKLEQELQDRDAREQELAIKRKEMQALSQSKEALQEKRSQEEGHIKASAELEAARETLKKEMKELREKIDRLQAGQGTCPLCGTELGVDRCQHIIEDYERQGLERKQRYLHAQEELARSKAALDILRQELQAEGELEKSIRILERRIGVLEREVERLEQAASELPALQQKLTEVKEQLSRQTFAQEERRELLRVRQEIAALHYDDAAHQEMREKVEELRPFEARYRELEQAQRLLPQEQANLARVEESIARWQQALQDEESQRHTLEAELKELPEVERRVKAEEERFATLDRQRSDVKEGVARLQGELARLQEVEKEKKRRQEEHRRVADDEASYRELAVAFGKKGVQALLIEQAIPEIEQGANDLLARLTGNRMSLKLDTQKQTRKGQAVETLEIAIADELGTRSYEMYSGGEAFRINFALRIALSRLLARRAGAAIPVLFIDEGFGTQDTSGLDRFVEAISSILDDFQKILVITHIEEMKELFPVRIEVTKTPEGSVIAIT